MAATSSTASTKASLHSFYAEVVKKSSSCTSGKVLGRSHTRVQRTSAIMRRFSLRGHLSHPVAVESGGSISLAQGRVRRCGGWGCLRCLLLPHRLQCQRGAPPPPPPPPPPGCGGRVYWNVATTVNRGSIYRASNVAVEDGALVMRTIAESYRVRNLSYFVSSGAVNTEGKFAQRYGRWQASVRLPRPNESPSYTLHSSIWLNSNFYARQPTGKGCADEIDVIEQYPGPRPPNPVSRGAGSLHVHDAHCVHMPAETGPHNGGDMIWTRNGDFTSKWTTFTLDWTPAWLSIRANNETLAVYTNKTLLNSMTDVQPLILTATVMERTPTLPDDVFPQEYWVDWVRIYEWL
jgi:hypothetical protein